MPVVRGKDIEVLFSASAIARRNLELAKEIAAHDYHDLLVISVLKGSFIFAADLIRAMHDVGLSPEVEFIFISSYGAGTTSGEVRVLRDIDNEVAGRDVLLIDDILESGKTLKFTRELMLERGAKSCCHRRAARQAHAPADRARTPTMSASTAPTISSSATAWTSPMPSANCRSSASSRAMPDAPAAAHREFTKKEPASVARAGLSEDRWDGVSASRFAFQWTGAAAAVWRRRSSCCRYPPAFDMLQTNWNDACHQNSLIAWHHGHPPRLRPPAHLRGGCRNRQFHQGGGACEPHPVCGVHADQDGSRAWLEKALFERGSRGVALTRKGNELLSNARRIVSLLDETAASMSAPPLDGPVRIGIPEEYGHAILSRALGVFAKRHPQVEITVRYAHSASQMAALNAGELDLAVVFEWQNYSGWRGADARPDGLGDIRPASECMRKRLCRSRIYQNSGWCRDFAIKLAGAAEP